jgi:ketosteroid isomerase-like protein
MTDVDEQSAREIRQRLEEKAAAYAARDVDAVLDFYEHNEDVSIFDPGPPDEYKGFTAITETIGNFIRGAESMDLTYQGDGALASGDIGSAWSLVRIKTGLQNGVEIDVVCRQTNVWRRGEDGKWRVVHEHNSVTMAPEQADSTFSQDPDLAEQLGSGGLATEG